MAKRYFADYFPVPRFLEMSSIGVDIREDAIRFVEIKHKKGRRYLGRFGVQPLPRGAIEGGEIKDKETLRGLLRLLHVKHGFKFVHVSLPEEKGYIFKTEVPAEGQGSIRDFLELRLEENVPLGARELEFDFSVIKRDTFGSEHLDVAVSAMPTSVIGNYLTVLYDAGFSPLTLQPESSAVARSVIRHGDLGTFLLLNMSEVETVVSIASEGVVRFSSVIEVGGDSIVEAIAKHFKTDFLEALKIKKEKGFTRSKENVELIFSLTGTVETVKNEIARIVSYWQTHRDTAGEPGKKISHILLCGKNAALVGFDEYLSLSLKMRVEEANVWTNVFSFEDYIPPVHFLDSLDFAAAVGLALTEYS